MWSDKQMYVLSEETVSKKCLTIKQLTSTVGQYIFIDIRVYFDNHPTVVGIILRYNEFAKLFDLMEQVMADKDLDKNVDTIFNVTDTVELTIRKYGTLRVKQVKKDSFRVMYIRKLEFEVIARYWEEIKDIVSSIPCEEEEVNLTDALKTSGVNFDAELD